MKLALFLAIGFGLSACSDSQPKTGVMPGVATGGYDAPTNAEAAASYMAAFQARYDIPELDYPEDIKKRIKDARLKRLQKDMRNAARRQEIMAKLALTVMARKDPEAKALLEEIKNNPKASEDASNMNWMMTTIDEQPRAARPSKAEREKAYQTAMRDYKKAFRSMKIEDCRWTEMKRLIGSNYEAMAVVHGAEPTHGFRCVGDRKLERQKGYPRNYSFFGDWVKSPTGDWLYYGPFRDAGFSARRQLLDPALMKNPEKAIARQSFEDSITDKLR